MAEKRRIYIADDDDLAAGIRPDGVPHHMDRGALSENMNAGYKPSEFHADVFRRVFAGHLRISAPARLQAVHFNRRMA